jgi:ribonuclease HI
MQKVSFIWVKGHANNKENERCDFLAVQAAEGKNLVADQWYENNVANKGDSLF